MKYTITILILICLFFPSISVLNHTYQSSLWTSDTWRKNSEQVPIEDMTLRFGTASEESGIHKWYRIRLGLIVKPITIDYQNQLQVLQIRFEPYYFRKYSLPFGFILVGIGVIAFRLFRKSK